MLEYGQVNPGTSTTLYPSLETSEAQLSKKVATPKAYEIRNWQHKNKNKLLLNSHS